MHFLFACVQKRTVRIFMLRMSAVRGGFQYFYIYLCGLPAICYSRSLCGNHDLPWAVLIDFGPPFLSCFPASSLGQACRAKSSVFVILDPQIECIFQVTFFLSSSPEKWCGARERLTYVVCLFQLARELTHVFKSGQFFNFYKLAVNGFIVFYVDCVSNLHLVIHNDNILSGRWW